MKNEIAGQGAICSICMSADKGPAGSTKLLRAEDGEAPSAALDVGSPPGPIATEDTVRGCVGRAAKSAALDLSASAVAGVAKGLLGEAWLPSVNRSIKLRKEGDTSSAWSMAGMGCWKSRNSGSEAGFGASTKARVAIATAVEARGTEGDPVGTAP
jgi:hypothetical protein